MSENKEFPIMSELRTVNNEYFSFKDAIIVSQPGEDRNQSLQECTNCLACCTLCACCMNSWMQCFGMCF